MDALIRLGHLPWRGGEDRLALEDLDRAIGRADEPDQLYLAHLIAKGWHALKVEVPKAPAVTIRARSGYFGSER